MTASRWWRRRASGDYYISLHEAVERCPSGRRGDAPTPVRLVAAIAVRRRVAERVESQLRRDRHADDDAEDRDDVKRRPDEELREGAGLVEEVLGLGERVEPVRKSTSVDGVEAMIQQWRRRAATI